MSLFDEVTQKKIDENKKPRINWKQFFGCSLDTIVKGHWREGLSDEETYKKISKVIYTMLNYVGYTMPRDDWPEVLENNIGSTYSRLNSKSRFCVRCRGAL